MRILALCSYPIEAAATRFRLAQFIGPLKIHGIELEIVPFLSSDQFKALYHGGGVFYKTASMVSSVLRRLAQTLKVRKYDLLFVQREAMIFGPAIFEWMYSKLGGLPIVLDLDDATYVHYVSPTYGRLGSFFKFFGKTDNLIKRAKVVTCGNRFIAEYVEHKGTRTVVVPTVVDLEEFRPGEAQTEARTPVVGWIGTHSTFSFLESIFPVLEKLAETHQFILKIVGSGQKAIQIEDVEIENLEWEMEREIEDFRSLDIGLYPITVSKSANPEWIKGKSGFKAVQYMACGVPFVMSPVGVCAEMGRPGETHFNAEEPEDWYNALNTLLADGQLRSKMGAAGRDYALEHYALETHAGRLAETLHSVVQR